MKRNFVFIVLMTGLFMSAQVMAQDVKVKDTKQKTESKTEVAPSAGTGTKTGTQQSTNPPAVQSSKEGPGTGQQTSTSSSTKSQSSSGSKQSGTMTTASSAQQGSKIYDAEGKVIYKIDATGGWIRDPKNRLLGQYSENGEYYTKNRVKAGSVENGIVRDKDGKEFAKIGQDGKVYTSAGKLMGTIADDGTISDDQGKKIGSAPGVDKNIAALVFFLKPANLANTGSSSGKKH